MFLKKSKNSISNQIFLRYFGFFAFTVTFLAIICYFIPFYYINKSMEKQLLEEFIGAERIFEQGEIALIEHLKMESIEEGSEEFYSTLFKGNNKIFSTDYDFDYVVLKKKSLKINEKTYYIDLIKEENNYFKLVSSNINHNYNLFMALNTDNIRYTMDVFRDILMLIVLICYFVIYFVVKFLIKKTLSPLYELSTGIEVINNTGDISLRLNDKDFPYEISNFAYRFNKMLEKINMLVVETREISNVIAHDIKTPLTSAKIAIEKLIYENKDTENENALALVSDNINKTINIMNSILYIAGLIADDGKNSYKRIDILELLKDTYNLFYDLAEMKDIELSFEYSELDRFYIYGNEKMFQRIMSNLLDNAIKYTQEKGLIKMSLYKKDKNIFVVVSDNGIGIEKDKLDSIFKKFFKIDEARTKEGVGLGLSIVKLLVQKLNGNISVNSIKGKGSEFILVFKEYN